MDNPPSYPVPIRMSSAGHCPRQQAYASLEYEASDPPDRQSQNRMALGDAAENILIDNMTQDGWVVRHTRAVPGGEQLAIGLADPPMTGHPDGVCRHPVHTDNRWLTLECKSMSSDRLRETERNGIAATYPEYLAQVACYSRILYRLEIVDEPRRAVFAYMDREGNQPAPETVSWDEDYELTLRQQIAATWKQITQRQLPERPYAADDRHCRYCRYFTICQGQAPDWRDLPQPQQVHEPHLLEAAQQWQEANQIRNAARQVLIAACPDPEHPGIIAGDITASWFIPNSRKGERYDTDLLRTMLTAEQLRQARHTDRTEPGFWIRSQRD